MPVSDYETAELLSAVPEDKVVGILSVDGEDTPILGQPEPKVQEEGGSSEEQVQEEYVSSSSGSEQPVQVPLAQEEGSANSESDSPDVEMMAEEPKDPPGPKRSKRGRKPKHNSMSQLDPKQYKEVPMELRYRNSPSLSISQLKWLTRYCNLSPKSSGMRLRAQLSDFYETDGVADEVISMDDCLFAYEQMVRQGTEDDDLRRGEYVLASFRFCFKCTKEVPMSQA